MKCTFCEKDMIVGKDSNFHYILSGLSRIYLKGVKIYKCSCGEEEVEIPNIQQLHNLMAQLVAKQVNKLLPEEIRFLRTHLGMSGVDFSRKMGIDAATVSRWENGKSPMGDISERFLRLLVIANAAPVRDYQFLDNIASKEAKTAQRRVLKVSQTQWLEDRSA